MYLNGLREIKSLIFGNVKKLNSTSEAFDIALKVFDVIVNNIDVKIENPTEKLKKKVMVMKVLKVEILMKLKVVNLMKVVKVKKRLN